MRPTRHHDYSQTFLGKRIKALEQFNETVETERKVYHSELQRTFYVKPDEEAIKLMDESTQRESMSPREYKTKTYIQDYIQMSSRLEEINQESERTLREPADWFPDQLKQSLLINLESQQMTMLVEENKTQYFLDMLLSNIGGYFGQLQIESPQINCKELQDEILSIKQKKEQEDRETEIVCERNRSVIAETNDIQAIEQQTLQEELKETCQLTFETQRNAEKSLLVQILLEQFHSQRRFNRSYCYIAGKKNSDMDFDDYEKFFSRSKNLKTLQLDTTERLKIDEQNLHSWWSASKRQGKGPTQIQKLLKSNNYKFDRFINHDKLSSVMRVLGQEIGVSIRSALYPNLEPMHKQYSFNSKEYSLLFNRYTREEHSFISPMKKIQCEIEIDYTLKQINRLLYPAGQTIGQTALILFVFGDKDRGLLNYLLTLIELELTDFQNQLIQIRSLDYTIESFQVKEIQKLRYDEVAYATNSLPNLQAKITELNSVIFKDCQFDIRVSIDLINVVTHERYVRQINLIAMTPLLIENQEVFARQIKSAFKREKGPREALGSKIETLVKNADKCLLFVELPPMIKMNGKEHIKITKIKNILDFYSSVIIRRKNI